VDLAGSEKRETGMCLMDEALNTDVWVVHTDDEIVRDAAAARPGIVAIDAPLSIPRGRRRIDDREGPHFRECDLMLRRMGIRFFPVTLGPMRLLTARGMALRERLESIGLRVVEVYPGGAQDILGLPRKGAGLEELRRGLESLGIRLPARRLSGDELDAVTAAYVGLLYMRGLAEVLEGVDGAIVMPRRGLGACRV